MTPDSWTGVAGFAFMLVLIAFNVPIGVAMGIAGVVGLTALSGVDSALNTLGIVASGEFVNYNLSVVPLFVLMGVAASASGMSRGLYRLANAAVGHRTGGLAMATIGSSAMFSAVCGSSLATAATMAKVAMPEMRRHGYDDRLGSGAVAAGGALGILIPPSVILIVYSLITETPLFDLFAAALIPGLITVAGYLLVIALIVWFRPAQGPASPWQGWTALLAATRYALPVIALFMLVLGGIYGGVFTPTEAAAIGAIGALIYLLVQVGFDRPVLTAVALETIATTAMIFIIIIGAGVLTFFLSFSGLPRVFAGAVAGLDVSPYVILIAIMVCYLILGCFMESLGIITLTVPVLFPLVQALAPELGMTAAESAVWFGIFVVIAVEIGMLTPPLGLNVFVIKGAIKDIELATIFRGVVPFWIFDVVRLTVLAMVPSITLFLPRLL
ncbi:C4-dicarboxylate ABC transporter permease [Acuticoccus sediminis]|uniref:TRAP transporter large permease protein n=1 Tax=Acuticoccus sediminis TaxID=2184697 RepID=A0A8B2NW93_9HYPH|nr:TRAP transporter large permease [Acuticoccus sediminis]RAI02063.1 C4-dicarboxylate ABC transporter permease [Acuticoccus sediminis]